MRRSAVFLAFLAFYLATMSGTIASSDGHTMLQLTRSIAERGRFDIPSGNGFPGVAGRFYPKAGLGQALAAVPFYQVARVSAALVPALQRKREAWIRYVVQLLNPLVMALLMWIFLLFLEETGVHSRDALVCAALLGVSTPLWPYAKSFLTEPLTALLLLAGFRAAWHFGQRGRSVQAVACGACIGALVLVKMASLLSALGLGAYLAWQAWQRREVFRALLASALPVLAFAVLILHYNFARFGNLTESGYMSEQTAAAYGTPLLVGLYGLLFSSGKGLLWFAPLLVLLPWAVGRCWSRARAELVAIGLILGPSLMLYATFRAWAGDGSWGPRYLVPFLPLLALPIAWVWRDLRRPGRWAAALLALGILVQWGGVSIYYGSYLRDVGAYPYRLPFEDSMFLADVHFVPNHSPIAGHWRMFARNLREHLRGDWPRIHWGGEQEGASVQPTRAPLPGEPAAQATAGATARIPVPVEDQGKLLHSLDFWFLYPLYVGMGGGWLMLFPAGLLAAAAIAWSRAWRGVRGTS